jgi:metal-responsive CopG/Arc/MetJ family transcriptional regulator
MKTQRITVALPRNLVQKLKRLAADRGTSVAGLATTALEDLLKERDEYERARKEALARMRKPPNLGTRGRITWSRDSLHERR